MKHIPLIATVLLILVHLGVFVHDFQPAGSLFGPDKSMIEGFDLSLRRNEAACVLDGVNPYDVWSKKVVKPPYHPHTELAHVDLATVEPINAYTPWEYVVMFPAALMPKQVAWRIHTAIMLLSFVFVLWVVWRFGGFVSLVSAMVFLIPVNVDLNCGNFGLVITAATVGMLISLDRGDRLLPVFLWTLAMFKPQMSVLLSIPLLLRRQWLVGIGAAGLCFGLSLIPAYLCQTSVVDLIRQAPAASAHAFTGCALMPEPLLNVLSHVGPSVVWMGVSMFLGVSICIMLTIYLRDSRSWFVLALPAMICAVSWTYVTQIGYILMIPVAALLAADMVQNRTIGRFCVGIPAILLWARFARGAEILAGRFLPASLPVFAVFCQLSATVALALTIIYIVRYAETLKRQACRL